MINWILQKNLTKPDVLDRIKQAVHQDGEIWEEIEVIPFSKDLPDIQNKAATPVVYGSTTFMLNAFQNENYKRGVFYDPQVFQMKNYVAQWGAHNLNHEGQCILLSQIKSLKSPSDKKWFLRPNDDGKDFNGKVETFEEIVTWADKIIALDLPDFNSSTEIWIAPPQNIFKEWRLFIVDDQIISASKYLEQGELNESATDIPDEMLTFAKARIEEYRLANIYVMDIAQVTDGFKIIECNCFNGTGFYNHDIEKIVVTVNAFLRSKNKINSPS